MKIDSTIPDKASDSGYVLDMLGRPVKVGDTILTKGYRSVSQNTLASVVRVNKRTVSITVARNWWNYATRTMEHEDTPMLRKPYEILVLPADYLAESTRLRDTFVEEHPEIFI